MPTNPLVACNAAILNAIQAWSAYLNAGSHLALYRNNFVPVPGAPFVDYQKANFTGATPKDLTGLWTGIGLINQGEYGLTLPTQTFTMTAGTSQTIYGWLIYDPSNTVYFAGQLALPQFFVIGTTWSISISLNEIAQSIL